MKTTAKETRKMKHQELNAWIRARNECPDDQIYRVEAQHASALGLPTLAAIYDALDQAQHAAGPVSPREMEALLTVASVARGEARERLRIAWGDETIDIPGVPTIPRKLVERDAWQDAKTAAESLVGQLGGERAKQVARAIMRLVGGGR